MKPMIIASIILFIVSFTAVNYTHSDPDVWVETASEEHSQFIFSKIGETITAKYSQNVSLKDPTDADQPTQDDEKDLKVDDVKAQITTFSGTIAGGAAVSTGDSFTLETEEQIPIAELRLYQFEVIEEKFSFQKADCDRNWKNTTQTETVSKSCYILAASGSYQLDGVTYDYTDNAGTNHNGSLSLSDSQKQANTLHCKDQDNLIDMKIDLVVTTFGLTWLPEYMANNGYDDPNFTTNVTDAKVGIVETGGAPPIAVSDPDISDDGEIHFDWKVEMDGGVIHLVLNPVEYPFTMDFKRIRD